MNNLPLLGLLALTLICCKSNKSSVKEFYISSNDSTITVKFNDRSFPWEVEKNRLILPYNGDTNDISLLTTYDTLNFELRPGEFVPVSVIVNKKYTVGITVKGLSEPANYDANYIAETRGIYDVQLPEVHELINIAFSLTETGKNDKNLINQQTEYYSQVQDEFAKYTDHPLVTVLNKNMESDGYWCYYNLKMNACMYSICKGGSIVNNSPYDRLGWGENRLEEQLKWVEDFAATTGFRSFYAKNESYYRSLLDTYHHVVPVKKMWGWLEERFSDRYDSYKIYFSPLVGGAHATQNYSDNGYKETIMFVNAPIFPENYTQVQKELKASRVVFTEIDHNYINPISDDLSKVVSQSFSERFYWVLDDPGLDAYSTPYSVFNEYMTWSLFSLYCIDNFPVTEYTSYLEVLEKDMIRKRGFVKFDKFNRKLIEVNELNSEISGYDLVGSMLEWSASIQVERKE